MKSSLHFENCRFVSCFAFYKILSLQVWRASPQVSRVVTEATILFYWPYLGCTMCPSLSAVDLAPCHMILIYQCFKAPIYSPVNLISATWGKSIKLQKMDIKETKLFLSPHQVFAICKSQSCIKFKKFRSRSVHHNDLREKIKIKFTGISDLDLSFQLTMIWCELKFMASSQRDKNPSIGRKEY